jgi:hypothetical protein
MAKKETLSQRIKVPKRIYTIEELVAFDVKIEAYKLSTGLYDWRQIYIVAGIHNKDGAVMMYQKEGKPYIPQVDFENKVEQWDYWKKGKDWVNEQRMKDYQSMSEQQVQAEKDFQDY